MAEPPRRGEKPQGAGSRPAAEDLAAKSKLPTELLALAIALIPVTAGLTMFVADRFNAIERALDRIEAQLTDLDARLEANTPRQVFSDGPRDAAPSPATSSLPRAWSIVGVSWCVPTDGTVRVQGRLVDSADGAPVFQEVTLQVKVFQVGASLESAGPAAPRTNRDGVFVVEFPLAPDARSAYLGNVGYQLGPSGWSPVQDHPVSDPAPC